MQDENPSNQNSSQNPISSPTNLEPVQPQSPMNEESPKPKKSKKTLLGVILLIAGIIVGAGGVFAYNYYLSPLPTAPAPKQEVATPAPAPDPCPVGDETGADGVFCSEDLGISFKVPEAFAGKIEKAKNEDVYKLNESKENGDKPAVTTSNIFSVETSNRIGDYPENYIYDNSLIIRQAPFKTNLSPMQGVGGVFKKDGKLYSYNDSGGDKLAVTSLEVNTTAYIIDGLRIYKTYRFGEFASAVFGYTALINNSIVSFWFYYGYDMILSPDASRPTDQEIKDVNAFSDLSPDNIIESIKKL